MHRPKPPHEKGNQTKLDRPSNFICLDQPTFHHHANVIAPARDQALVTIDPTPVGRPPKSNGLQYLPAGVLIDRATKCRRLPAGLVARLQI